MERLKGNELRADLIEENLINEAGIVNAITVNYISGAHTLPLLSEVWDLYLHDIVAMTELQNFLNEVYEKKQFSILIGILKILYSISGLPLPHVLQRTND